MTSTSFITDLQVGGQQAPLQFCRHCRKPEGEHAAQGEWCPNPENVGRLWLSTQFQSFDPSIPRFNFQAPDDLGLTDRECRLTLAFLIGWFKQPGVGVDSSDEFQTAMNLALQGELR